MVELVRPLLGIVTVWTTWLNDGRARLHVDDRERVGLREVRAQRQSAAGEVLRPVASIASFGDAWKVGSGLIVIWSSSRFA